MNQFQEKTENVLFYFPIKLKTTTDEEFDYEIGFSGSYIYKGKDFKEVINLKIESINEPFFSFKIENCIIEGELILDSDEVTVKPNEIIVFNEGKSKKVELGKYITVVLSNSKVMDLNDKDIEGKLTQNNEPNFLEDPSEFFKIIDPLQSYLLRNKNFYPSKFFQEQAYEKIQKIKLNKNFKEKLDFLINYKNLQSLDLNRCDQLVDIQGLSKLTRLQSLDLSWCFQLENIQVLSTLTGLKSLNLSGCDQLENIQVLSTLTGLESLNLSGCDQLENIQVLSTLIGLESLDLSGCEQLENIQALSSLTKLKSLDLSGCEQLIDIKALSSLIGLRSLNLSGCKQLIDIKALSSLIGLRSLNLSGCKQLINIQALSSLIGLESLDLSECKHLIDIQALSSLTGLKILNLSGCKQLINIQALSSLTELQNLELKGCEEIIVDFSSLITNLKNLDRLVLPSHAQNVSVKLTF